MTGQLVITVETVTPIFLGGAQARELADAIRPTSIRGQVRYWLRAMLGAGIYPAQSSTLDRLKTVEGYFMGDTEAGSPVRYRVRTYVDHPLDVADRASLPHKVNPAQRFPMKSFSERSGFEIILSPRPGRSQIADEVVAATLLWLYLGGLGKRARRGFGSLQPVKFTAGDGVISAVAREHLPVGRAADAAALRKQIAALLNWLGGVTPQPAGAWVTPALSDYSVLHPDVAGVRVSDAVKGYNLPEGYHEAVVPFWMESLRADALRDERAYGYAKPNDRRASPFHFHIARTDAGYHQVFTTFWSKPSPDGTAGWKKVAALLADVETRFGAANLWGRAS